MITRIGMLKATLSAAVVLLGAQVYAHTQAFFSRTGNFTFSGSTPVPLNQVGATEVTFTGSGRRTLTYTAECAKTGTSGWVTIAIVVDGEQLAPTGGNTGDAFCSANTTSAADEWVMAATQARTKNFTDDGPHTVQVLAAVAGGIFPSGTGHLGDSTLQVGR
jgi:hypothetical protein